MKRSVAYTSVGTVALLILASLSSVIGFSSSQPQSPPEESPLFAIRTARSTNDPCQTTIRSDYLGKGRMTTIFPISREQIQSHLDFAVKMLLTNPSLAQKLFERISESSQVHDILTNYGLRASEVKQYFAQMADSPEVLQAQVREIDGSLDFRDISQPNELSTSSVIGCFVVILALLPLAIVIGFVVATLTIVTCLNISGCAEMIIRAILVGIAQELTQP